MIPPLRRLPEPQPCILPSISRCLSVVSRDRSGSVDTYDHGDYTGTMRFLNTGPRRRNFVAIVLVAGFFLLMLTTAPAAGKAQHVVIVVMDGLRPDAVADQTMPTLAAMAHEGTVFANHHPVYPSMTEVNGTALATGTWPAHSGVIANREYRPDVDPLGPVDTQGDWASWKGDQVRDGQWIKMPTLVEMVREKKLKAVAAGTKPVIMIGDCSRQGRSTDQPLVFEGKSIPSVVLDSVIPQTGPIPPVANPKYRANSSQDHWTSRVLLEQVWKDQVPALTVLWLSEPDYAQHGSGPGSAVSKSAWKSSDDCLARLRAALAEKHVADKTDILVVSDHGFSTISRTVDVVDELKQSGFDADKEFAEQPKPGKVLVVGLGGSASFYVTGHDRKTLEKLMDFLQRSDWAGVIFTREGLEGTFKMGDAGINAPGGTRRHGVHAVEGRAMAGSPARNDGFRQHHQGQRPRHARQPQPFRHAQHADRLWPGLQGRVRG